MPQDCAVCGDMLEPYLKEVRDPLTNQRFSIDRCIRCGLGHTVPRPPDTAPYYPDIYYGNRHGFTARRCNRRRMGFVSSAMPPGPGKRLLDIGCGDGSFLSAARENGWVVVGTELNPRPARLRGLDVKETIEEVSRTDPFDCITMWHCLEHICDIKYALMLLADRLKPCGKLIVSVPDNGGLQATLFGRNWLHLDVPRHLYHFDSRSLRECLASAGFSIRRQWHQELEYDLIGWSQSALNCVSTHPNRFFDSLTGKRKDESGFGNPGDRLLGSLLTVLFVPALVAGTLLGLGGTLVAVAQQPQPGQS